MDGHNKIDTIGIFDKRSNPSKRKSMVHMDHIWLKVFDKFYRLQDSKTGGTGLGLSIVKGFVEAQNGKVTVVNREEGGALFELKFPALEMHTKNISNE